MKISLEEIKKGQLASNVETTTRGWKLFMLLPRMLLCTSAIYRRLELRRHRCCSCIPLHRCRRVTRRLCLRHPLNVELVVDRGAIGHIMTTTKESREEGRAPGTDSEHRVGIEPRTEALDVSRRTASNSEGTSRSARGMIGRRLCGRAHVDDQMLTLSHLPPLRDHTLVAVEPPPRLPHGCGARRC